MPRTYTQRPIVDRNILLAEDYNEELAGATRELNGTLGQHNMPLRGVGSTVLRPPTTFSYTIPGDFLPATLGTIGPCNAYYQSEFCDSFGTINYDVNSDEITIGWNSFAPKIVRGTVQNFTAREGMLNGWAQVQFEKYSDRVSIGGLNTEVGEGGIGAEFAVFVNGRLVAKTGKLQAGRKTVQLPFNTPISSGPVEIAVKWKATNAQYYDPTGATWREIDTAMTIYSVEISTRNSYR